MRFFLAIILNELLIVCCVLTGKHIALLFVQYTPYMPKVFMAHFESLIPFFKLIALKMFDCV